MGEGTVSGAPGALQSGPTAASGARPFPVPYNPKAPGSNVSVSTDQPLTDAEVNEIRRLLVEKYPIPGHYQNMPPEAVRGDGSHADATRRKYGLPIPGSTSPPSPPDY